MKSPVEFRKPWPDIRYHLAVCSHTLRCLLVLWINRWRPLGSRTDLPLVCWLQTHRLIKGITPANSPFPPHHQASLPVHLFPSAYTHVGLATVFKTKTSPWRHVPSPLPFTVKTSERIACTCSFNFLSSRFPWNLLQLGFLWQHFWKCSIHQRPCWARGTADSSSHVKWASVSTPPDPQERTVDPVCWTSCHLHWVSEDLAASRE